MKMPSMGRHSLALEVASRPASRARRLSVGMMGRLGVSGDGATLYPRPQLLAALPTSAQGQPVMVENRKLPKASIANCSQNLPGLCHLPTLCLNFPTCVMRT